MRTFFQLVFLFAGILPAMAAMCPASRLANARKVYESPGGVARAYNCQNGGFVIMAGERMVGYSDSGSLDMADMPPALLDLLEAYAPERGCSRDRGKAFVPVAPLLDGIAYDQNDPYNRMCPEYAKGSRSAVGCAATAMAQIMRYYRYPERGKGSHAYTPEFYPSMGRIEVDFSESVYDWDNMPPTFGPDAGEEQCAAVARLMYDAGVAVSMSYGPMSGALSEDWPAALVDHFSYDDAVTLRFRSNYGLEDWEKVIRTEIDNGRPVYVTGFTEEGGHAFVFDGYDESGLIHVNWGWSGMSNGYFDTTFLTPSTQGTGGSTGGFNSRQMMVTGIMPECGAQETVTLVSEEGLSEVKGSRGSSVRLNGKIYNVGWRNAVVDFALLLSDCDGNTVREFPGPEEIAVRRETPHRNLLFDGLDFNGVPDGTYRLDVVASAHGSYVCERVRDRDVAFPNYLFVTVKDGAAAFRMPASAEIKATECAIDGMLVSGMKGRYTVKVSNVGESEYYDRVKVILEDETGIGSVVSDITVVDVMPGTERTFALTGIVGVVPGTYRMAVADAFNKVLGEFGTVEVGDGGSLEISAVSPPAFPDAEDVDPFCVEASAVVNGGAGVFSGHLFLYFYKPDSEDAMGCIGPVFVQAVGDNEVTVRFVGRFENAMPGEEYDACVVNGENFTWVRPRELATARFRVRDTTMGITPATDGDIGRKRYFNLQGVELSCPPSSGVWIETGVGGTVKISK